MGGKQKKNWRKTNNWLNFSLIFFSCLTNKRASYRWAGIGFEGETGQDDGEIDIEGRPFDLSLIRNALNIRIGLAKAINGVENPKLPGNGAEEAGLGVGDGDGVWAVERRGSFGTGEEREWPWKGEAVVGL